MKRRGDSENFHSGWLSLSDILTVLVCALLFLSMYIWSVQASRRDNVHETLECLTSFESQVEQIQKDVMTIRTDILKAEEIAESSTQNMKRGG